MSQSFSSIRLHLTQMELHSVSSSWSITSPFSSPENRKRSLPVVSAKKSSDLEGLVAKSKGELSRILRTEAAVIGIERKAGKAKFKNLWPRAVLEALDDSIASNRWESALKVGDRHFTDVVYGNRNGFLTILTEPLNLSLEPFVVKQVRKLEGCLVKHWHNKGLQPAKHILLPEIHHCIKASPS